MSNILKIIESFKNKPYLVDMGAKSIASRLNANVGDVNEARSIFRKKDLLKEYCDEVGIDHSNVNHYWHKGKHFSLHVNNENALVNDQMNLILEECRKVTSPVQLKSKINKFNDNCAVVNIYDIHLDKRNINGLLDASEQVNSVIKDITAGFDSIILSANVHSPHNYIIPVGNDIFCTNGFMKTTKAGTPQDPVVPHEEVFKKGLSLVRYMIDTLSLYGRVIVPIIYGNHDADAVWYLGVALEVLYENNENVEILNKRDSRKFLKYGENLFGFGHGDIEKKNIDKLPLIMATKVPKFWAETKNRIFFLGDMHHKEEYKFFRTKDNPGCTVQFLRSAGVVDLWHDDNMFVGVPRSIEVSIFDSSKGQIANYSVNI